MPNQIYFATIKNGEIRMKGHHKYWYELFDKKNEGADLMIEVDRRDIRSLKQNAYLWGVVYKLIALQTGAFDLDEVHQIFAGMFLRYTKVHKGKVREFVRSTTKLRKGEFSDYVEKIRLYCLETGALDHLEIPDPDPEYFGDNILKSRVRALK